MVGERVGNSAKNKNCKSVKRSLLMEKKKKAGDFYNDSDSKIEDGGEGGFTNSRI